MSIAVVDFTVANTVDWSLVFNLTRDGEPWDVTGYSAKMQMRSTPDTRPAAATMTTEAGTLIAAGTTLTMDFPRGLAMGVPAGTYVYDCLLINGDEVTRAFVGTVTVEQGITR